MRVTEILPSFEDLGIGFVAYSPLGRGFFTGKSPVSRHCGRALRVARYVTVSGDNLRRNLEPMDNLEGCLAAAENCTPAGLALAWTFAVPAKSWSISGASHPIASRCCRPASSPK